MIRPMLAILITMFAISAAAQDMRTISVTGIGEIAAPPDMATIRVGVQTSERRADEAMRENSALMSAVLAELQNQGVDPTDMQTSDLSLYPQYDNRTAGQGRGIAAFVAQNTLTIRLRDMDRLGAALDAINRAGANQIQGVQFGLQDPRAAMEAARIAAVADGRAKAALYARAAEVTLGRLIRLDEGGSAAPRPMAMARAESMAMDVPIAEGELTLSARVNMVFEIK